MLHSVTTRAQPTGRYEFESRQMGTLFRIVLYAPSDSLADAAAQAAFQRIEELDAILSDYKPDSELNRLSRSAGSGEAVPVSEPLFTVLSKALEVSRISGGAFDVTVGPYISLWRGMQRQENPKLPSAEALSDAAGRVGYRNIKINREARSVRLTVPGMQLDLGGIAKGYALDEALRVLREHDIRSALIDGGGDIVLGEAPPGKDGWMIEVTTHDRSGTAGRRMLELSGKAVATSGDLYQHITIDGTRYSHIINPETGLGLTDQSKVTIVAADGITADSYASAVSVLGPKRGLDLVEQTEGMEAYIERNRDGRIERRVSGGFGRLTVNEP